MDNVMQSGGMGNGKKETLKEKQVAKFRMVIEPAVPIELRHQISELIEQHGYNVWSQGEFMNNSACDILFDMDKK